MEFPQGFRTLSRSSVLEPRPGAFQWEWSCRCRLKSLLCRGSTAEVWMHRGVSAKQHRTIVPLYSHVILENMHLTLVERVCIPGKGESQ